MRLGIKRAKDARGPFGIRITTMKTLLVTVPFAHGLHARPAARLVKTLKRFRARVSFRCGEQTADARSILSLLLLSAGFKTQLEIQAWGPDEAAAIQATEAFFQLSRNCHCDRKADSGAPPFRPAREEERPALLLSSAHSKAEQK